VNIVPGTVAVENYLKTGLSGQAGLAGEAAGAAMAEGTGKTFGSRVKGLLGPSLAIAGTAAAYGFTRFVEESVKASEEAKVADDRINQVAKSMGLFGAGTGEVVGRLNDYSSALMKNIGVDDESIKATQAKLLTFKELAKTADTTGGAFDRATAAAYDLASAGFGSAETNAVQLGKALQDPVKGITALARSGVTFTEAEKKRIETLVKSNKMGEAQNLVLKAIEQQVGGTAAATATASQKMSVSWGELKEQVGGALAPAFAALATALIPVVDKLAPVLAKTFEALTPVLTNLTSVLPQLLTAVMPLLPAFGQVVALLGQIGVAVIPPLIAVIKALIPPITSLLPLFLDLAMQIIKPLAPLVVALITSLQPLIAAILPVLSGLLKVILPIFLDLLKSVVIPLIPTVVKLVEAFGPLLVAVLPILVTLLNLTVIPALKLLSGIIQTVLVPVIGFLVTVVTDVIKWFSNFGPNLAKAGSAIGTWFKNLPGLIGGFLKNAATWLLNAGKNIIEGLINGIKNGVSLLGGAVKGVADTVINGFKNLLGIHSPSKVFHEFGRNILQGLTDGLTGEKSNVADTMQKVSDWLISAFDSKKISKAQEKAGLALVKAFSGPMAQYEAQYKATLDRLDQAQADLQKKIEERANYVSGLAAKFGSALDIQAPTADAAGTTAADAIKQLQDRIAKTEELQKATDTLLKMGLDKSLYKQIVEAGAVDFAKSIIEGGQTAVDKLNVLSKEADKKALELSNKVGDVLFGQGIKFAESVVKGLTDKKTDLEDLMSSIASAFETSIGNIVKGQKADIKAALTDAKGVLDGAVASAKAAIAASQAPVAYANVQKTGNGTVTQQVVNYYAAQNESLTSEQQLVQAVQRVGRIL
jgi:phage-related protein